MTCYYCAINRVNVALHNTCTLLLLLFDTIGISLPHTYSHTCTHTHTNNCTFSQELSQSRTTERGQKFKRHFMRRRSNKSNTIHGSRSLSKLSSSDQNLSRGSSNLVLRGRSRSNLSLGKAPSMTSVMEEPRKSTSTTSELIDLWLIFLFCSQSI